MGRTNPELYWALFLLFLSRSVASVPLPTDQDAGGLQNGNEAATWSSWTPCSVTKGEGVMYRSRKENGETKQDVMKCFVIPCNCSSSGTDPEVQTPSPEPDVATIPTTASEEKITTGPLCGKALGASFGGALSGSSFQATSMFSRNLGPHRGRLNGPFGWCSSTSSVYDFNVSDEYFQVDLGSVSQICAVATQGYRGKLQRIYSFELHYSMNGQTWTSIKEDGDTEIFIRRAGENSDAVVIQDLTSPIRGRYVRFKIRRFIGWPCLRVELYGDPGEQTTTPIVQQTTTTPTEKESLTSDEPTKLDTTTELIIPTTAAEEQTTPTEKEPTKAEATTEIIPTTAAEEQTTPTEKEPTKAEATTEIIPTTAAEEQTTPTEKEQTTSDVVATTTATKGFEETSLELHNNYRKIHNAAPLSLNSDLSRGAESYAKTLFDLGALSHSDKLSRPGQGENLAKGCSSGAMSEGYFKTAIKEWYDEVCKYNFNTYAPQDGLGHFSQMIWKATSELGIGKYTGQHIEGSTTWACTVLVARYKTVGNVDVPSYYKANVDEGSFDKARYC